MKSRIGGGSGEFAVTMDATFTLTMVLLGTAKSRGAWKAQTPGFPPKEIGDLLTGSIGYAIFLWHISGAYLRGEAYKKVPVFMVGISVADARAIYI